MADGVRVFPPCPDKMCPYVPGGVVQAFNVDGENVSADSVTNTFQFPDFEDLRMLTLTVVSDGAPEDAQTAVSLAYNSGLVVKVVDKDGKEFGTVSAVPTVEEVPVVDEPHPVLEKEVPPVEPTPEVAPEVVVSESSP